MDQDVELAKSCQMVREDHETGRALELEPSLGLRMDSEDQRRGSRVPSGVAQEDFGCVAEEMETCSGQHQQRVQIHRWC